VRAHDHDYPSQKLNLRLLCSFANTLNSHLVLGEVDTGLLFERIDDVFKMDDIEVLADPYKTNGGSMQGQAVRP
jgi:hypothetical protein